MMSPDPVTVRMKRQAKIDGRVVKRGQTLNVPRQVAQFLIEQNRAERIEPPHPPFVGYQRCIAW